MEILLGIELILIVAFACIASSDNSGNAMFVFLLLAGGIIATIICLSIEWNKPEAIDVYRGKTTLEITYKDSVAIDSVVVFKNK